MLLNISLQEHKYTPINGLAVSETDEVIKKLLTPIVVPTEELIDFNALNIVQRVLAIFKDRKKEIEEQNARIEEWKKKFDELSEEDKDKFSKDGYLIGFQQPPFPLEDFTGVLIGEDVPNYLAGSIITHCMQNRIRIYFNYLKDDYSKVEQVPTDIEGISENVNLPSGNKTHIIFLYSDIR